MNEQWKHIPGFEGVFFISDQGSIKSTTRFVKIGKGYGWVCGKIYNGSKNNSGYLTVTLSYNGNVKSVFPHILTAIAFVPNPENLVEVNHENGIKTDNRAGNLKWCTHSQNAKHAFDTGLNVSKKRRVIVRYPDGAEKEFESTLMACTETQVHRFNLYRSAAKKKAFNGYKFQFVQ
jgi:hypothetical protein